MNEALQADHLSKSFDGRPAVLDVSFSVQAGEILGLIGPNGAGKTTTIRMLLHILQPDAGEVSLFGRPPDGQARDRIDYLPEERCLDRQARVSEVLVYLGGLKGISLARRPASGPGRS